jgi:hypothetical protein
LVVVVVVVVVVVFLCAAALPRFALARGAGLLSSAVAATAADRVVERRAARFAGGGDGGDGDGADGTPSSVAADERCRFGGINWLLCGRWLLCARGAATRENKIK